MNENQQIYISVIIPVYNAENTIATCLEAVINQSYPKNKYEIILVDDGSTDNTAQIAKRYSVRYHYQLNQGPATARNKGASLALGEIILFTDSDCIVDHYWIEEMSKSLEDMEVIGVMGSYSGSHSSLWSRFSQLEFEERYKKLCTAETVDMIATYSAAYRKDAFITVGGFDGSFPAADNEDTDLSYRLSEAGSKLIFNPKANVYHLGHPDSIYRYAKIKFWRGYWRMVVYEKNSSKMINDSYTPKSLKLQSILAPIIIMCIAIIPVYSQVYYLAIIFIFMFLLSIIPFMRFALERDAKIAALSPILLFIRGLSIGSGALYSLIRRKLCT